MTFAHPYFLLLLLALPLLGWWRHRREQPAALLYSSTQLLATLRDMTRWTPGRILSVLRWAALVLFIIGLARPQHVESETTVRASGIDIVTALDLSTSMASEDPGFTVRGSQANRLEVAKDVLKRFVQKRGNDRIGVVAFAGRAYIAAPLTLDHEFLRQNLDRLDLHTIEDGTAIGSALGAAVNRLRDIQSKSKIVILMTDGPEATVGEVMKVPFPRPRVRSSVLAHAEYQACRRRVIDFLDHPAHQSRASALDPVLHQGQGS